MGLHATDIEVARKRLAELPSQYDWFIEVSFRTSGSQTVTVRMDDWQCEVNESTELHDIISCFVGLAKYEWY